MSTDVSIKTQSLSSESYSKAADTLRLYVESLTASLKHNQYLPYRPCVSQTLLWDLHRSKTVNQRINLSVNTKLMACSSAINPLMGKDAVSFAPVWDWKVISKKC